MTTDIGYVSPTYISCTETAKLIRKALKRAFPTVKFSVRSDSYANGASVRVSYTDGPTTSQVDAVVGVFAGADFDGMIDLKTHNDHWLEPDGTVYIAKREGTTGSFVGYVQDPRSPNARLVSFGADFVPVTRRLSPEVTARIAAEISEFVGFTVDPDDHNKQLAISVFKSDDGGALLARDEHGQGTWVSNAVWQIGSKRDYTSACSCPAPARYTTTGGNIRCSLCGA